MNPDVNVVLLDDVLFAFRRDGQGPTPQVVREWCDRHPRFAEAIREEAVLWAHEQMMATLYRDAEEDNTDVARARSSALSAVARAVARASVAEPLSWGDAFAAAGTDQSALARQLGLPRSVLARIVRGEIMGATIPETLTTLLARALRLPPSWVLGHYPATLAVAHNLDASRRGGQRFGSVSFQEAVDDAEDAEVAERVFWLEDA